MVTMLKDENSCMRIIAKLPEKIARAGTIEPPRIESLKSEAPSNSYVWVLRNYVILGWRATARQRQMAKVISDNTKR